MNTTKELELVEQIKIKYYKENKTQKEIAEELAYSISHISRTMRKYNLKGKEENKCKTRNLVNQKFGKLLVLEPIFKKSGKFNQFRWKCQCECGNITYPLSGNLILNKITSCGKCINRIGQLAGGWKGYENIPRSFLTGYRAHARRRKIEFDLTIEQLNDLFIQQNGRCLFTGEKLYFPIYKKSRGNASLDRIDSTKGYTINNVQWVQKNINLGKQQLSDNDFIELCQKVVLYHNFKKDIEYII